MYKFVRAILLGIVVFAIGTAISSAGKPAGGEFLGTWSAGRLLLHHQDPYNSAALLALERAQGFDLAQPIVSSNPPLALLLALPLALFPFKASVLLWMAAVLAGLTACLATFHVVRRHRILAYCFAPVFACLTSGDFSPFVLLGFSLFVLLYRSRPLLAGASLLLLSVEPHLLVILAPVMLLDCLYRRNLRLLAGAALAFAASFAVTGLLDLNLWAQYAATRWGSSPFGGTLLAPSSFWLQASPAAIAIAWALFFYWSKRRTWDWASDAVPLLFVTLLVAPFASIADQALLLPAVLVTVSSANRARYTAICFCAINAAALTLIITQPNLGAGLSAGMSMAWFAWYLYSRRRTEVVAEHHYEGTMVEA